MDKIKRHLPNKNIVIIFVVIAFLSFITPIFFQKNKIKEVPVDYKNTDFKMKFTYFGDDLMGDFNGDGKQDAAFLVTENPGGSGTFYYLVVALKTDKGYDGLKPAFLGDRITPESVKSENGNIVVNYLDRKLTEPMVTVPTVETIRTFKIVNGDLTEVSK